MRVFGFAIPLFVIIIVVYLIGARYPAPAQKIGVA